MPRVWAGDARPNIFNYKNRDCALKVFKPKKIKGFSTLDDLVKFPEAQFICGVVEIVEFFGFFKSFAQAFGSSGEDVAALNVLNPFHFFALSDF